MVEHTHSFCWDLAPWTSRIAQVWNLTISDEDDDDKAKQFIISSTQFSITHFNSQVHIQYTRVAYSLTHNQKHKSTNESYMRIQLNIYPNKYIENCQTLNLENMQSQRMLYLR